METSTEEQGRREAVTVSLEELKHCQPFRSHCPHPAVYYLLQPLCDSNLLRKHLGRHLWGS